MKSGKILVQKINTDKVNLATALTLHEKVKETLPINVKAVLIPHTWEFKEVDDKVIYIGIDSVTHINDATEFVDRIIEDFGEEYTIVSNLCNAEVIDER